MQNQKVQTCLTALIRSVLRPREFLTETVHKLNLSSHMMEIMKDVMLFRRSVTLKLVKTMTLLFRVGVIFSGYSILQKKLHDAVRFFETCTAKTKIMPKNKKLVDFRFKIDQKFTAPPLLLLITKM